MWLHFLDGNLSFHITLVFLTSLSMAQSRALIKAGYLLGTGNGRRENLVLGSQMWPWLFGDFRLGSGCRVEQVSKDQGRREAIAVWANVQCLSITVEGGGAIPKRDITAAFQQLLSCDLIFFLCLWRSSGRCLFSHLGNVRHREKLHRGKTWLTDAGVWSSRNQIANPVKTWGLLYSELLRVSKESLDTEKEKIRSAMAQP